MYCSELKGNLKQTLIIHIRRDYRIFILAIFDFFTYRHLLEKSKADVNDVKTPLNSMFVNCTRLETKDKNGLNRDLNPGPLAPKARIIPLDH